MSIPIRSPETYTCAIPISKGKGYWSGNTRGGMSSLVFTCLILVWFGLAVSFSLSFIGPVRPCLFLLLFLCLVSFSFSFSVSVWIQDMTWHDKTRQAKWRTRTRQDKRDWNTRPHRNKIERKQARHLALSVVFRFLWSRYIRIKAQDGTGRHTRRFQQTCREPSKHRLLWFALT